MTLTAPPITRVGFLDKARGFAIVLMICDHVLALTVSHSIVRETVTRFSMPLFFLISGHLVRRFSWRIIAIGAIGFVLPVAVPWIDQPNVLFWYAVCAPVILLAKRYEKLPIVIIVALALAANHRVGGPGYWPFALAGLMAMGAMVPRDFFRWAERLPEWVRVMGRYPLSIYVGHLLLLEAFLR